MEGVPTDVNRYDGEYEHVFKSTTAGVTIQAPQVFYFEISISDKTSTIAQIFLLMSTLGQSVFLFQCGDMC
ncbi:unnamed protein product [Clavelina lepadiformis]|uniref:Uncharacterized protein n=1 Tax=Clavelina lepadiformis TaxID=159417 RepID=A0ABP0FMJ2_CLALP